MFEKNLRLSVLFDAYGSLLTSDQQNMFDLYYNEDLSLAEVADEMGITRQGVRDSIEKAKTQLATYEEKLGLAAKFREIGKTLDDIIPRLEAIAKTSDSVDEELSDIIKKVKTVTI